MGRNADAFDFLLGEWVIDFVAPYRPPALDPSKVGEIPEAELARGNWPE
jgi:hypothetical protein